MATTIRAKQLIELVTSLTAKEEECHEIEGSGLKFGDKELNILLRKKVLEATSEQKERVWTVFKTIIADIGQQILHRPENMQ